MAERQNGTVKWFNEVRGMASSPRSLALTCSSTSARSKGRGFKSLTEGQKVSFEAIQGQKGMQADKVRAEG